MSKTTTRYYQGMRPELAGLLPKQYSRVLEIGCGIGEFRKNFNQEHEYWGIEPVESVAELAKDNLTQVLIGTYKDVENRIPDNYFDLIICNDVIEHMPDHDEFLKSIKLKMRDNASLMASIPNVRYILNLWGILINKDWKYRDDGILDRTHLRFFTRKSLLRTLTDNEYSIEQIIGINSYRPESVIRRVIAWFTISLLGQDIKYLQFGVRIKDANHSMLQMPES